MIYLRSCPKCHGDMYLEKDSYGTFRQCLQCGLVRDLAVPALMTAASLPVLAPARRGRPRKVAIA